MHNDMHVRLAKHLAIMGMGLPYTAALVDILKEVFSPREAEVALLLPATDIPLKAISVEELLPRTTLDKATVVSTLEGLAARGVIYSGHLENGSAGYALHQAGFGSPQVFFWKGAQSDEARKMTRLVLKYFNRNVTREAFGGQRTKAYRYIPINQALDPAVQAIMPHDHMDTVLDNATRFAVAHCPCRVEAALMGRPCEHPLEVCLKFDEMADFLIQRGLGKKITRTEARDLVRRSAEAGLVHFVDNVVGKVMHNCNCCGCACWNVGTIRRRKIPRDELMAVYFTRKTLPEQCTGCGACVDICPVQAIELKEEVAVVDQQWCIGCGVCALRCEFDALQICYREDQAQKVSTDFDQLHATIRMENKQG